MSSEDGTVTPRTYQLEMLEESMKGNIIVAMDTGSGKTHVAVLRIQAELERMAPEKLIWFLAPTVSLCAQHHEYLHANISSVLVRFLSGADHVDHWTEQGQWNAILKDVKIVVSTYQILLDALTHGFVRMDRLSLIIFDEAHNCINKAPGAKIMSSFYDPNKINSSMPHILGLTASPIMSPISQSVIEIEKVLHAVCRTPKKHQADLRLRVRLPVLSIIQYSPEAQSNITSTMASLRKVWTDLDFSKDPYMLELERDDTERGKRLLDKLRYNRKTQCQKAMRALNDTSTRIHSELGSWAADYYISEVISKYKKAIQRPDLLGDATANEKRYLAEALSQVEISPLSSPSEPGAISGKVAKLLEIIAQQERPYSAIIFAQERATVSVLATLLAIHPTTKDRLKIGKMVGTSTCNKRADNVGDLIDPDEQKHTLSRFKNGKLNLLVATNVLEEGIDVKVCNLVICFNRPSNLKSFVQRRGRARQQDSKLVLLDTLSDKLIDWHQLERNMREMYENDMRELQTVLEIEAAEEHLDKRVFLVESTGARLDLDNAISHLYHFCAVLPMKEFAYPRPDFIFTPESNSEYIRAKVILPPSIDESLRVHESRRGWRSEKQATKDAAFEAYVSLYKSGLVNDNLLPLMKHDELIDELTSKPVDVCASIIAVKELVNPWTDVASAWELEFMMSRHRNESDKVASTYVVTLEGLRMELCLPIRLPHIPPLKLYWDTNTEYMVDFENTFGRTAPISRVREENELLMRAAFGHRFPIEQRPMVVCFIGHRKPIPSNIGSQLIRPEMSCYDMGLIRETTDSQISYIFRQRLPHKPPIEQVQYPYSDYLTHPENVPHLHLTRMTKRSDFLHRVENQATSSKPFSYVLPVPNCTEDKMPFEFVRFGMLIPSIIYHIECQLIVDLLVNSTLYNINISQRSLIQTAITASSTGGSDYQRLEFLGDSMLKFCTSIQLMAEHPLWHEGYLSAGKDRLVSNSRLSRAAVKMNLDNYIITKKFTGLKWRPMYVDEVKNLPEGVPRQMSTKILADVVEALIGASMVDGGIPKVLSFLQQFIPELPWLPLETRRDALYQRVPENQALPTTLQHVEKLIGYTFSKKAILIEAMTHPSYSIGSQSFDRLEFLGDAILDNIIVSTMWSQPQELSHIQMHRLKASVVNADFLAFLGMEMCIDRDVANLVEVGIPRSRASRIEEVHKNIRIPLHRFLRHSSSQIAATQALTSIRHSELRSRILEALETGMQFPWVLLARLQAKKFFSDLMESLLGAVWIDSGSMEVCTQIVEKMGILPYARRALRDGVDVWHPKEQLGVLADDHKVKYVVTSKLRENGTDEEEGEEDTGESKVIYACKVFVDQKEIVEVIDGVSKEEVQVKAAEIAVQILRRRKNGDVTTTDGANAESGDKMVLD